MLQRIDRKESRNTLNVAMNRQVCVHGVTGRAPLAKKCPNNYACGRCEYDQMLDDMDEAAYLKEFARRAKIKAA